MADVGNGGLAIQHLYAAQFGQDLDGEPQRSMVYKQAAIYWFCIFRWTWGGSHTCTGQITGVTRVGPWYLRQYVRRFCYNLRRYA